MLESPRHSWQPFVAGVEEWVALNTRSLCFPSLLRMKGFGFPPPWTPGLVTLPALANWRGPVWDAGSGHLTSIS